LAPDAELVLYRNFEWTEKREFRRYQRNLEVILFLGRPGVKVNRNFLLSESDSSPEVNVADRTNKVQEAACKVSGLS
jgi:hypothetical protein